MMGYQTALAGLSLSSCRSESGGVAGADTIVFRNGGVLPVDTGFSEHTAFAIQGNRVLAVTGRNAPVFMLGALLQWAGERHDRPRRCGVGAGIGPALIHPAAPALTGDR